LKHETSAIALVVFAISVAGVLALSFWLGRRAQSASGYFAAHGQVGWFVNGVAFAGDYLSAASFLGICGLIAFHGYDGFLYSIGYLAGWIVALFVIAEPIRRLGKYTFADALNARFASKGIQVAAAISTLVVSVFYLIPQMVGAGVLVQPLLGLPHWAGVVLVGIVVTTIVATAGMVSTTWVQFIKGSLLLVFCTVLVALILDRGLVAEPAPPRAVERGAIDAARAEGQRFGTVAHLPGGAHATGPLGPVEYVATLTDSEITTWERREVPRAGSAEPVVLYEPVVRRGDDLLRPGASPAFRGVRGEDPVKKLDVLSLMLALFLGTASLPHILIRYYTVKDAAAARKSTVVGIVSIAAFYVLTLYLGLGAMTSGALDPTDSNMSAPLLARSFSEPLFAVISAIAFTTVLGTVSGLVLAGAGAVAHDLLGHVLGVVRDEAHKVRCARLATIGLGAGAMGLGVLFAELNVSFLVGWAFNIAASANLPALVMLLYWSGTTRSGVIASILVGLATSLCWVLVSADALEKVFGLTAAEAAERTPVPFSQPALVTIPLSFATLVLVSLATRGARRPEARA
jgi:cation/acetate symporter